MTEDAENYLTRRDTAGRVGEKMDYMEPNMEKISSEIWRIRNRQVARLLSNLDGLNLPDIVTDGVKKYFDYMASDIEEMVQMETTHGKHTRNDRTARLPID
jgi:ribosomal protein L15E